MKSPLRILLPLVISSISQSTYSQTTTTEKSSDADLVTQLMREDLGIRTFAFADVVAHSSAKRVITFNREIPAHVEISTAIQLAINATIKELNHSTSPVKKLRRINEASRYFEQLLLKKLAAMENLDCTIPLNAQGKTQRSGYPDLKIKHLPTGNIFYLDPKLYEKKSRASSLRTFYFEPKTRTMKIQDDAVHLLLGISHDGVDGNWTFTDWNLVDLAKLKVRLKIEFQTSNKSLYRDANIIQSSK